MQSIVWVIWVPSFSLIHFFNHSEIELREQRFIDPIFLTSPSTFFWSSASLQIPHPIAVTSCLCAEALSPHAIWQHVHLKIENLQVLWKVIKKNNSDFTSTLANLIKTNQDTNHIQKHGSKPWRKLCEAAFLNSRCYIVWLFGVIPSSELPHAVGSCCITSCSVAIMFLCYPFGQVSL